MSIFDKNLIKINVLVSDKEALFEMMVEDFYQYGVIIENPTPFLQSYNPYRDIQGKTDNLHTSCGGQNEKIRPYDDFLTAIKTREMELSTGIGNGVAIPHARHKSVKELKTNIYILSEELDFDALDGFPVKIVIMMAIPTEANKEYMSKLGFITKALYKETNRNKLLASQSQDDVIKFFINGQE